MRFVRLAVVLLIASVTVGASEQDYEVSIETHLSPRMSPQEVAQIVRTRLSEPITNLVPDASGPQLEPAPPEITSMRLVTRDEIGKWTNDKGEIDRSLVWVVHANGTFINFRVPPGRKPTVRKQGFYIISDETGNVIGRGSFTPEASETLSPGRGE